MATYNDNSKGKVRIGRYPLLRKVLIGFIVISLLNLIISYCFYTPKLYSIDNQNREMVLKYNILQDKIRTLESKIDEIHHRDIYVYRALFSTDTMAIDGIYTPYPESKYEPLKGDMYTPLMTSSWKNMDALSKKTYSTTLSLDQLQILAKNKERMSFAIPAIWPIDRTQLRRISSLYGMRKHPRYGTWRKHEGVDLSAPKGAPVYATGNAVVMRARWEPGYGKLVELNHGFGYKTRYGHLSKIYVSRGDSVKRGQIIGEVGNTGVSEGSHLHYEVRFRDKTVNPIHYFNKDMSPEAYIELMNQIEASLEKN